MANYTQKAILNVFEEILHQMPFDKITVSALVAKCEISSNTFYYHYRDIYDLLETWLLTKKISWQKKLILRKNGRPGLSGSSIKCRIILSWCTISGIPFHGNA